MHLYSATSSLINMFIKSGGSLLGYCQTKAGGPLTRRSNISWPNGHRQQQHKAIITTTIFPARQSSIFLFLLITLCSSNAFHVYVLLNVVVFIVYKLYVNPVFIISPKIVLKVVFNLDLSIYTHLFMMCPVSWNHKYKN